MNLVLKKEKTYFRENWLKFLGIWGAAELFWGFGEHKQNTFRELRQKLTGIWGDQSIIFRELGSKDPPWGALLDGGTTDGSRRITTGLAITSVMYMPADMRVDI